MGSGRHTYYVIYTDVSNAFDCVSYSVLIKNISLVWLNNNALLFWFSFYIVDGYVKLNVFLSDTFPAYYQLIDHQR